MRKSRLFLLKVDAVVAGKYIRNNLESLQLENRHINNNLTKKDSAITRAVLIITS